MMLHFLYIVNLLLIVVTTTEMYNNTCKKTVVRRLRQLSKRVIQNCQRLSFAARYTAVNGISYHDKNSQSKSKA